MSAAHPSFFARIGLAFRVLFSGEAAARVVSRPALPAPAPERAPTPVPPPPVVERAPSDAALQLLAMFQREGRFVDFLEEDVSAYSDGDIGAAARKVHEGCRKALREHIELEPVHTQEEGESVTVEAGFDPSEIRLTGNVSGEAPFKGELAHRGWKVVRCELPKLSNDHDVHILAPAEVELA